MEKSIIKMGNEIRYFGEVAGAAEDQRRATDCENYLGTTSRRARRFTLSNRMVEDTYICRSTYVELVSR